MRFRSGPFPSDNPGSGPRLPQGPKAEAPDSNCIRQALPAHQHGPGIRFQAVRYGRTVLTVYLCGECVMELRPDAPPDPLFRRWPRPTDFDRMSPAEFDAYTKRIGLDARISEALAEPIPDGVPAARDEGLGTSRTKARQERRR